MDKNELRERVDSLVSKYGLSELSHLEHSTTRQVKNLMLHCLWQAREQKFRMSIVAIDALIGELTSLVNGYTVTNKHAYRNVQVLKKLLQQCKQLRDEILILWHNGIYETIG